jgi:hypothetical protein
MLVESLWESLAHPFEVAAWTDDAEAVALERDRQLETGEVLALAATPIFPMSTHLTMRAIVSWELSHAGQICSGF